MRDRPQRSCYKRKRLEKLGENVAMSSTTPFGAEALTIRKGEKITGGRLELDGNYFTGCSIIGAEVSYSGGNWGHDDPTQFIDCTFHIGDRAQFVMESVANLIGREQWITLFDRLRDTPPPAVN